MGIGFCSDFFHIFSISLDRAKLTARQHCSIHFVDLSESRVVD